MTVKEVKELNNGKYNGIELYKVVSGGSHNIANILTENNLVFMDGELFTISNEWNNYNVEYYDILNKKEYLDMYPLDESYIFDDYLGENGKVLIIVIQIPYIERS